MSYTKHDFKSGEKLYAVQLNEMDEQILKNESDISNLSSEIEDLNETLDNYLLNGEIVKEVVVVKQNPNLIDNVITVNKRQTTDVDNTITCVADENGVVTINGSCSSDVYVFLTPEVKERFPDGDYVLLSDNKDFSGLPSGKNYLDICFFRYGHNAFNTYRYDIQTFVAITPNSDRSEITLTRQNSSGFTFTKEEVAIGFSLGVGTYNNVKIRLWVVKKGENEEYSVFGTTETIEEVVEKISKGKINLDHNLRYAVATDIHWNHDDTENTNLTGEAKTQILVDAVNAEHHKKPLDFFMITGDINEGGDEQAIEEFKEKFLWQFEMPVVLFAGNHDGIANDKWVELTGYNRQTSLETEDFYFIFCDTFGDNIGKTWLSHYSVYYSDTDKAYIPCNSTDEGALLVGTDITVESVTPKMTGWSFTPKSGDYVKLALAKDCDMYKPPSLDYVKQEVEKAGDKYIVFITHQILGTSDGDEEGVRDYLNSLDNFLFYLEGHAHFYYDARYGSTQKWVLNSGHFFKPMGGWDSVASNNYRGFRIIEVDNNELVTYKVQPTQNVGTAYEHEYDICDRHVLFEIEKSKRADIDLIKLKKDKEFAYKLKDLEDRVKALES